MLVAFCRGRLPDADTNRVAEHLSDCGRCCDALDSIHAAGTVNGSTLHGWLRSRDSQLESPTDNEVQRLKLRLEEINPELPERIGRYFVVRQLGSGGMAHVYLARDDEHDRLVAIKVPRQDRLNSERVLDTFLDEARAASELRHPAIVPVYDFNRTEDGTCYVVMKYITGTTLAERLKDGPLPPGEVARIARTITDALAWLHAKGWYHRDVKPDNILLDDSGKVWLADFGLILRADDSEDRHLELAGTLPYMSPEQLRGDSTEINGHADLWSLGAVIHEMMTGTRPFAGNCQSELLESISAGLPEPESETNAPPPSWLWRICRRCLQSEVADRYADALALRVDLRKPQRRLVQLAFAAGLVLCAATSFTVQQYWEYSPALTVLDWKPILADPGNCVPLEDGSGLRIESESKRTLIELEQVPKTSFDREVTLQFQKPDSADRNGTDTAGIQWELGATTDDSGARIQRYSVAELIFDGLDKPTRLSLREVIVKQDGSESDVTNVNETGPVESISLPSHVVRLRVQFERTPSGPGECVITVNDELFDFSERFQRLDWGDGESMGAGLTGTNGPVEFRNYREPF